MDQTLSLYLLETLPLLDPESPDYALDVLTLVESILENPELILRKQLDRVKDRAVAQMKADGVEYEQRMEELEKLEYPKPLRDFVYETFNAFADRHPWVGEENIRPKSIAREMFENFRSFAEYMLDYELQRSEGLLLRHLNSVYKVLSQTVPDGVKTDEVREMELYLRTLLRQVDSSLEDEWERMRDPNYRPLAPAARAARSCGRPAPRRPRRTSRATRRRSPPRSGRGSSRSCAPGRSATTPPPSTRSTMPPADGRRRRRSVDAERLRPALEAYRAEHERVRLDPEARNLRHTHVDRPTTGARGACSRCSSTPRCTTTGWRSSTWTWPPRARRTSRCCGCGRSGRSGSPRAGRRTCGGSVVQPLPYRRPRAQPARTIVARPSSSSAHVTWSTAGHKRVAHRFQPARWVVEMCRDAPLTGAIGRDVEACRT